MPGFDVALLYTTTPAEITPCIKEFCRGISAVAPVYVPVRPEGQAGYCYPNCRAKVQAQGGEIVYGRAIWLGEAILQAEWHCIWRDPNNILLDITAKPDGETIILFLPTNEVWDGVTVWPNIRKPLVNDPVLDMLLVIQEEIDRNAKRNDAGEIGYDIGAAVRKLMPELMPETLPTPRKYTNNQPKNKGIGRNKPCPCGSGQKFKRCCGDRGAGK